MCKGDLFKCIEHNPPETILAFSATEDSKKCWVTDGTGWNIYDRDNAICIAAYSNKDYSIVEPNSSIFNREVEQMSVCANSFMTFEDSIRHIFTINIWENINI